MLILNSSNAADDARSFEAAGIGGLKVFDFAREGANAGRHAGQARVLARFRRAIRHRRMFALRCASIIFRRISGIRRSRPMPMARATVPGVAMVADNPTDHHIFLKAFTGVSDLHSSSIGIKARTGNGDVEIMEPVAFRDRFGVSPDVSGEGMTLNAMRFAVSDMARGRDLASAERNCLAAPCRTVWWCRRIRPWRNPDIRSRRNTG